MIEILKTDLKKSIKNSSKLIRTLNRIESRFQVIEKQNANQSTKAKIYASVIKTATKITRIENERKNTMKKNDHSEDDNDEKKRNDVENWKRIRKEWIAKHNEHRTSEKSQKSYKKQQKRDDEIKMISQWKFNAIFSIIDNQEKIEERNTMNQSYKKFDKNSEKNV